MEFGPGFLPTFLYYFTSTAVVFTLVASRTLGVGIDTGLPQEIGAVGGLVSGLIGAYFNRTMTFTVPFQNQKQFLKTLDTTLQEMGYQFISEEEGVRVYERSQLAKWLSGKVYVQLEAKNATIASRAMNIRKIRSMLEVK